MLVALFNHVLTHLRPAIDTSRHVTRSCMGSSLFWEGNPGDRSPSVRAAISSSAKQLRGGPPALSEMRSVTRVPVPLHVVRTNGRTIGSCRAPPSFELSARGGVNILSELDGNGVRTWTIPP